MKPNEDHDKSPDEYLQNRGTLYGHSHSKQPEERRQELLPKMFLASCFLALIPVLTRIKVVVFDHNNSAERTSERDNFTSPDLALFLPSLIGLVAFVFVPATAENPGI